MHLGLCLASFKLGHSLHAEVNRSSGQDGRVHLPGVVVLGEVDVPDGSVSAEGQDMTTLQSQVEQRNTAKQHAEDKGTIFERKTNLSKISRTSSVLRSSNNLPDKAI